MQKLLVSVSAFSLAVLLSGGASAQEGGTVSKAVGGYSFEDAAKEAEGTKNFHSADGHLTFAIVTHTAGNGFFDPVYVGATVAGNMIGAKILLLGSESPTDDPAREIEILNQIIQDPTIDGLIMTTPQAGAYDDIVKAAEKNGIPVATTNSFDGGIHNRLGISHTGQDASAAAIAGAALAQVLVGQWRRKGFDHFPERYGDGQHRGQQSRHLRLQRDRRRPESCRQARQLHGRRRSRERRRARRHERSGQQHHRIDRAARRRGRRLCRQQRLHPGAGQGHRPVEDGWQDLFLWLRPGSRPAGRHEEPATSPARSVSSPSCRASGRSCSSTCRSTAAFRRPISTRAPNS